MIDRLVNGLAGEKPFFACWSGFRDPQLVRSLAAQDFDVVVFDAQHGFHDETSILNALPGVLAAGKSPMVRLPLDRWDMAQKVLDFGVLGVIAPMINTKKDAETFAASAKYPKLGARSFAPRYAASLYDLPVDDYVVKANTSTVALAQVETRESYENLDDILAVDGIDGILMGPSDFSIFMTGNQIPDAYGPDTIEAVEDIAKRTRAAGKIAAAFCLSAEHANQLAGFGYQLISITMDASIIGAGAAKAFDGIER
ncbi:MAG: aldolase/citrate lyase family protein [Rhizobiaceae bacterium]|nr:aldolase/citrate lyase family protein [Rhizobiaceae bacterium]